MKINLFLTIFRPKHSTEYAALELVDRIITQTDKKEVTINFFLDLSKAFDTIDQTILLAKLRYCGIHDTSLRLLKRYLNNRKQYVEYEDTKSEILPNSWCPTRLNTGALLFKLMDGNLIFCYTRLSSHFLHICIAVSPLILHLPRTFSYNGIDS